MLNILHYINLNQFGIDVKSFGIECESLNEDWTQLEVLF